MTCHVFARRKKEDRLILNLGYPLYFRLLEVARNDGNQFWATVVSGGRERERENLKRIIRTSTSKNKWEKKMKNNCATPAEEESSTWGGDSTPQTSNKFKEEEKKCWQKPRRRREN